MKGLIDKIKRKCEQKQKQKELERKAEIYNLREKQKENEAFIKNIKIELNDIQKTFNELENKEQQYQKMTFELEENLNQIDIINSKPGWFIVKIFNNWKIQKLLKQCEKQKQKIAEFEKTISDKKNEIQYHLNNLLLSLK